MRLEDMSFTDFLTAEYDLRERQRKERMKKAEFEKYAKEHNIFYCTKELQEPCDDVVSRQAVLEIAKQHTLTNDYLAIQNLPSVRPQEPNENAISEDGTLTVHVVDGRKVSRVLVCGDNHWGGLFYLEEDTPVRPQEPKTGHYEKHIDHTDCIWYGSDSGCPVTCSQYRDGWNDAMDYIFKNGKGYQPYRHDG